MSVHSKGLRLAAALLATTALFVGSSSFAKPAKDPLPGNDGNPRVLPLGGTPYGMTYGEWGARWWQWALSLPLTDSPLNDPTGAHIAAGQTGPVWFLAGTFCPDLVSCDVAVATRTATIPPGKALFLPLLNAECSTFEGNGTTEAELLACALAGGDLAIGLFCEVDGVPLQNVAAYRAHSGLFTWGPLPADNIFVAFGVSAPAGTSSPSVQDGYYVMLPPLSAGEHLLHFGGNFGGFFGEDITYHLTVAGGKAIVSAGTDSQASPGSRPAGMSWGGLKAIYR